MKALSIFVLITFLSIGCGSSGGGEDPPTTETKTTTVSGTVTDKYGVPVQGAKVTITSTPVIVDTDKKGIFSTTVEVGDHHISIKVGSEEIYSNDFNCTEEPYQFGTVPTQYDPNTSNPDADGGSGDAETYAISVAASPLSGGSAIGQGSYSEGKSVTLTANSNSGYTFVNWTENSAVVSTNSIYTFTATGNRTLVANFDMDNFVTVDVSSSPRESGSISGGGNYDQNDSVTLTATPNSGYTFVNWTENSAVVSTNSIYTFTATGNRTLVANFIKSTELLNGRYDGVMKSPLALFDADLTYTTFDVSGTSISITQEHFFGETCIFSGVLSDTFVPMSASGTYKCSDFSSGEWSSSSIAKTSYDTFIAELEIYTGHGSYVAKYNGFLRESDIPFYYTNNPIYFYDSGNHHNLGGVYKGTLKSVDACAAFIFEISSSNTTIAVSDEDIEITQDSFHEGTCIYTGTITDSNIVPLSASGTYMCSNFDEGTWSSSNIALTGTDSFIAELAVVVTNRVCDYSVKYIGFK